MRLLEDYEDIMERVSGSLGRMTAQYGWKVSEGGMVFTRGSDIVQIIEQDGGWWVVAGPRHGKGASLTNILGKKKHDSLNQAHQTVLHYIVRTSE